MHHKGALIHADCGATFSMKMRKRLLIAKRVRKCLEQFQIIVGGIGNSRVKIGPSVTIRKQQVNMCLPDRRTLEGVFNIVTDFAVLLVATLGHTGLIDQRIFAAFSPKAI